MAHRSVEEILTDKSIEWSFIAWLMKQEVLYTRCFCEEKREKIKNGHTICSGNNFSKKACLSFLSGHFSVDEQGADEILWHLDKLKLTLSLACDAVLYIKPLGFLDHDSVGVRIDPLTGYHLDPVYSEWVDPITGERFDRFTRRPIGPSRIGGLPTTPYGGPLPLIGPDGKPIY